MAQARLMFSGGAMLARHLIESGFKVAIRSAGGGCCSPGTERSFRKIDFLLKAHSDELEKMTPEEAESFIRKITSENDVEKVKLPLDLDLVFDGWEICMPLHRGIKLSENQYKKAKRIFEKAMKLNRDNADAYNGLGFLFLWQTENFDDAEEMYKVALVKAAKQLGHESVDEVYKCDVCKDSMWKAAETRPFMRALEGLGWAYFKQDNLEAALETFNIMLRLNPDDNQGARYMIGSILLKLGMVEEAIRFYERFWKDDIEPSVKFNFALALFLKKRIKKAATVLRLGFFSNIYIAPILIGMCSIPVPNLEKQGNKLVVKGSEAIEAANKLVEVIENIKKKETELGMPVSSFCPEDLDIWYYLDTEKVSYAKWYCELFGDIWDCYPEALEFLKKLWYHPYVMEEVKSFIDLRRRMKNAQEDEKNELDRVEKRLIDISRIQSTWFKIASILEKEK